MNYHLDDIVKHYKRRCDRIYQNKAQHLKIYEAGIVSKVQEDYNQGLIVDANDYFNRLSAQYQLFEDQINNDIETDIVNETHEFTKALSSFLLLEQGNKYHVSLSPDLISTLKQIYTGNKQQHVQTTHTTTPIKQPQSQPVNDNNVDIQALIDEIQGMLH